MNNKAKIILIGSALLVATTGTSVAFNGYGNCYQSGPGMQGRYQYNQMQRNMQGMPPMNWRQGMQGQRKMRRINPSPMRGVYRLNNLSSEQLQQLDALRQAHQEFRNNQQAAVQTLRIEMKKKVESILTEEQRKTLNRWNSPNN